MKVLVYGYGAMGKLLCEMIENSPSIELVAAIATKNSASPAWIYSKIEEVSQAFDLIIDFSHPLNLDTILETANAHQVPVVICTTGYNEEQQHTIEKSAKLIPIILASNTSQGINLMHSLVKKAVQTLAADFDIEIVEAHHNKKLDAPSGTAQSLLESVQSSLPETYTVEYGRSSMAKRENKEIGMHSLRGGTIVGEHQVILAGEDEIIEIKHTALSKKIFAKGALRAAQFALKQSAGLYSMEEVIA